MSKKKAIAVGTKKAGSRSSPRLAPKSIQKRRRQSGLNDDIDNNRRHELLQLILKLNSIRQASLQLGINNSTAKSIFYKFKQTGEINKNSRCNSNIDICDSVTSPKVACGTPDFDAKDDGT